MLLNDLAPLKKSLNFSPISVVEELRVEPRNLLRDLCEQDNSDDDGADELTERKVFKTTGDYGGAVAAAAKRRCRRIAVRQTKTKDSPLNVSSSVSSNKSFEHLTDRLDATIGGGGSSCGNDEGESTCITEVATVVVN